MKRLITVLLVALAIGAASCSEPALDSAKSANQRVYEAYLLGCNEALLNSCERMKEFGKVDATNFEEYWRVLKNRAVSDQEEIRKKLRAENPF